MSVNTDNVDPYLIAKSRAWKFVNRKDKYDPDDTAYGFDHEKSYLLSDDEFQTTFQVERWKSTFPDDMELLPAYVKQSMAKVSSKYSKAFYFFVAYEMVKKAFNEIAVGDDDAEKMSAVVQSMTACPGPRAAYVRCTEVYHSIDITTRLSLPAKHQVDCQEPFVALEQCLEHHLATWAKHTRTLNRFKEMQEYKEYYEQLARDMGALYTVSDTVKPEDDPSKKFFRDRIRLVDHDYVAPEDVEIAEQVFTIKRLFPHVYNYYKSLFEYYKTPANDNDRLEKLRFADRMSILDPKFDPYNFDINYVLSVIDKVEDILGTETVTGHSYDFRDVLRHVELTLQNDFTEETAIKYPYVEKFTERPLLPPGVISDPLAYKDVDPSTLQRKDPAFDATTIEEYQYIADPQNEYRSEEMQQRAQRATADYVTPEFYEGQDPASLFHSKDINLREQEAEAFKQTGSRERI